MACASSLEGCGSNKMEEQINSGRRKRLHLLDLPLDIIKCVIKEVTHTNDLPSLALTSRTLHELVTPLIYSRFDIIWPDGLNQTESRTGVDALTFGLATLVMGQDLFERYGSVGNDSYTKVGNGVGNMVAEHAITHTHTRDGKSRKGNYYSQFVKEFSLGNGPPELVQDYLVTKDSGKLLGTMVALALARMPNLEAFVWDMPTGIVRDIWLSLSSLGDCWPVKLDKVFIRFHDNRKAFEGSGLVRSASAASQHATAAAMPPVAIDGVNTGANGLKASFSYTNLYHVETPNFSVLPPLRSVSAIDIDELANLNELSLLIAKSADKLQELRVGMARELHSSGLAAKSRAIQYLDPRDGCDGTLRLLLSGICKPSGRDGSCTDVGKATYAPYVDKDDVVELGPTQISGRSKVSQQSCSTAVTTLLAGSGSRDSVAGVDTTSIDPALKAPSSSENAIRDATGSLENKYPDSGPKPSKLDHDNDPQTLAILASDRDHPADTAHRRSVRKLGLVNLELERHVLNIRLLHESIDLSILTSLTLLKCVDTHDLWCCLRDWFAPMKQARLSSLSTPTRAEHEPDKRVTGQPRLRRMPNWPRSPENTQPIYRLSLKRLHTDTVSTELIAFLRETLSPNSLEWLFLQDCPEYKSPVTLSQIYKGPLKRHRASLTKLMLNSAHGPEKSPAQSLSARKWMLNREILAGLLAPRKAPKLRELSISLEYKDWHWFLQQLPNAKGLRSLHIPVIADHVWGNNFSIRDVAMGVVDVINLRQECELAYLAITNKCFEIVEARVKPRRLRSETHTHNDNDDSSGDDITPHVSDEDDVSDDDDGVANSAAASDAEDNMLDDDASSSDEEDLSGARARQQQVKMKLREILFYDDKISIFKARHAKL